LKEFFIDHSYKFFGAEVWLQHLMVVNGDGFKRTEKKGAKKGPDTFSLKCIRPFFSSILFFYSDRISSYCISDTSQHFRRQMKKVEYDENT